MVYRHIKTPVLLGNLMLFFDSVGISRILQKVKQQNIIGKDSLILIIIINKKKTETHLGKKF